MAGVRLGVSYKFLTVTVGSLFLLAACSEAPQTTQVMESEAPWRHQLNRAGINPRGKTELEIDMSRIHNPQLAEVFDYIDTNIDSHVENLQRWIQQPSVSNTGEGIQESAYMVEGFFDQLGCQETEVVDPGITEYGSQANPVVYAICDEGAEKTMAVYWMYDTMPITQPDLWLSPPFEARIVEQPPFDKVIIGRGATNSKGRQMAFWNAMMSIKAVAGSLPVNPMFIAEVMRNGCRLGTESL